MRWNLHACRTNQRLPFHHPTPHSALNVTGSTITWQKIDVGQVLCAKRFRRTLISSGGLGRTRSRMQASGIRRRFGQLHGALPGTRFAFQMASCSARRAEVWPALGRSRAVRLGGRQRRVSRRVNTSVLLRRREAWNFREWGFQRYLNKRFPFICFFSRSTMCSTVSFVSAEGEQVTWWYKRVHMAESYCKRFIMLLGQCC